MLYTKKQMMEEVYQKVDEERIERKLNDEMCRHMCYDAMLEVRKRLDEIESRILALETEKEQANAGG